MTSVILVGPLFEDVWPFAAEELRDRWAREGDVEYRRLAEGDGRPVGEVVDDEGLAPLTRIVSLGVPVTEGCLATLATAEEAAVMTDDMYGMDPEVSDRLEERGVETYGLRSEGFWGQSVAEHAVGLALSALRQIPQKHGRITESHDDWDRDRIENDRPGARGYQYVGEPPGHVHGTLAGKNVRIVGVGNIGSRFAEYASTFGADVAAFDPYADEPAFHRTGTRQVHRFEELLSDADVFAPMVPLTDATRGLITAERVRALPEGALLVAVTRAGVCDMDAVRERVLADEIALAADVFDTEPLPLDDPLLGRENVVHTPHVAGRTRHANAQWAEHLASQFQPRESGERGA